MPAGNYARSPDYARSGNYARSPRSRAALGDGDAWVCACVGSQSKLKSGVVGWPGTITVVELEGMCLTIDKPLVSGSIKF